MKTVRNLTGDALHWSGHLLPPGEGVPIPDDTANRMVAQAPERFAIEDTPPPLPPQEGPPAPRSTPARQPKPHRDARGHKR